MPGCLPLSVCALLCVRRNGAPYPAKRPGLSAPLRSLPRPHTHTRAHTHTHTQERKPGDEQVAWVQSQTTFAVLHLEDDGSWAVRVAKQKIWVGGVSYELQVSRPSGAPTRPSPGRPCTWTPVHLCRASRSVRDGCSGLLGAVPCPARLEVCLFFRVKC